MIIVTHKLPDKKIVLVFGVTRCNKTKLSVKNYDEIGSLTQRKLYKS